MERFEIKYLEVIKNEHIPNLPKSVRKTIKEAIENRLTQDPISLGKPLQYSLKGHRRIRVSNYRIIYRIDLPKKQVIIVAIDHRKDVYDD